MTQIPRFLVTSVLALVLLGVVFFFAFGTLSTTSAILILAGFAVGVFLLALSAPSPSSDAAIRHYTRRKEDPVGFIGFLVFIVAIIAGGVCFVLYLLGLIDIEMLRLAVTFLTGMITGGATLAGSRKA